MTLTEDVLTEDVRITRNRMEGLHITTLLKSAWALHSFPSIPPTPSCGRASSGSAPLGQAHSESRRACGKDIAKVTLANGLTWDRSTDDEAV